MKRVTFRCICRFNKSYIFVHWRADPDPLEKGERALFKATAERHHHGGGNRSSGGSGSSRHGGGGRDEANNNSDGDDAIMHSTFFFLLLSRFSDPNELLRSEL